jgi:hypothetical protein
MLFLIILDISSDDENIHYSGPFFIGRKSQLSGFVEDNYCQICEGMPIEAEEKSIPQPPVWYFMRNATSVTPSVMPGRTKIAGSRSASLGVVFCVLGLESPGLTLDKIF